MDAAKFKDMLRATLGQGMRVTIESRVRSIEVADHEGHPTVRVMMRIADSTSEAAFADPEPDEEPRHVDFEVWLNPEVFESETVGGVAEFLTEASTREVIDLAVQASDAG